MGKKKNKEEECYYIIDKTKRNGLGRKMSVRKRNWLLIRSAITSFLFLMALIYYLYYKGII